MAALLTNQLDGGEEAVIINDVLPMTLGIKIKGGQMYGILKRGSAFPSQSEY